MRRYLLAYDADCGPCTRFKRYVEFLDSYGKLDFTPLIEADEKGFLDRVPTALRHRAFHLISPSGEVLSGAKALPTLVNLLPTGTLLSKVMTMVPGGFRATAFVYGVAARLHDTGSCRYHPGEKHAQMQNLELFNRFGFSSPSV